MAIQDMNHLKKVFDAMRQLELAIARMYALCADAWPIERGFWADLEAAEIRHARYIEEIQKMVVDNPEGFESGRVFNEAAILTNVRHVESICQKLKSGTLSREQFLFMARDVEKSLMEDKYMETVKTNNLKYRESFGRLQTDTAQHKKTMEEKIAALAKK